MIARIDFDAFVVDKEENKYRMRDYVDIHVSDLEQAKQMFGLWLRSNTGIRGGSGVFHPVGRKIGYIKVTKIGKRPKHGQQSQSEV